MSSDMIFILFNFSMQESFTSAQDLYSIAKDSQCPDKTVLISDLEYADCVESQVYCDLVCSEIGVDLLITSFSQADDLVIAKIDDVCNISPAMKHNSGSTGGLNRLRMLRHVFLR